VNETDVAIIYIMQAGIPGDLLHRTIDDYVPETVELMGKALQNLFAAAVPLNLLMLDAKPEHLIWVEKSTERRDPSKSRFLPKFIHFDAGHTIKLNPYVGQGGLSLNWLNKLLFLSHIACKAFQKMAENPTAYFDLLYLPLIHEISLLPSNQSLSIKDPFFDYLYELSLSQVDDIITSPIDPSFTTLRHVGDLVLKRLKGSCERDTQILRAWHSDQTFYPIQEIWRLVNSRKLEMIGRQYHRNVFERPGPPVNIMTLDWKWIFLKSRQKAIKFNVIQSIVGQTPLTATFKLTTPRSYTATQQTIILPGYDQKCVSIKVDSSQSLLSLDDLFYKLGDGRIRCQVEPKLTLQSGSGGYGAMVLNMIDCLAHKLSVALELEDEADFAPGTIPKVSAGSLTKTQCLTRGFGYYEARGWISKRPMRNSTSGIPSVEEVGIEKNREYIKLAQQADLLWTHMITTTPVNGLLDAIKTFPSDIHILMDDEDLPYLTENYSELYCQAHADHTEKMFLDDFRQFLSEQDNPSKLEKLSLRQLAATALDPVILTTHLTNAFNQVWPRFKLINGGVELDRRFPYPTSGYLTKPLFLIDNTVNAMVCKPNPLSDLVPLVSIKPIETDLEIKFI
jgi:hypothetical protein